MKDLNDLGDELIVAMIEPEFFRRVVTGMSLGITVVWGAITVLVSISALGAKDLDAVVAVCVVIFMIVPTVIAICSFIFSRLASDKTIARWMVSGLARWTWGSGHVLPGNHLLFFKLNERGISTDIKLVFRVLEIPWSDITYITQLSQSAPNEFAPNKIFLRFAADPALEQLGRYLNPELSSPCTHEIELPITYEIERVQTKLVAALHRFAGDRYLEKANKWAHRRECS